MRVYKNSAIGFRRDVENNSIADIVEVNFRKAFGKGVSNSEKMSWRNSMGYMERIIRNSEVADDCGVFIEYTIPTMRKRIDFLISGHDEENNPNFVIIELKQWESAEETDKGEIVKTVMGGAIVETTHPSYQAHSYKVFLGEYNEEIYNNSIIPSSCAYLHNYKKKIQSPYFHPFTLI